MTARLGRHSVLAPLNGFAGPNRIAIGAELPSFVFSTRPGKGVDRRTELNVSKTGSLDYRLPPRTRQGTGNSTRPQIDIT